MLVNTKILKNQKTPHVRLCNTINERNFNKIDKYIQNWLHKFDGLLLGSENFGDDTTTKNYAVEFSPIPPKNNKERPPCSLLKDNILDKCRWKGDFVSGKKTFEKLDRYIKCL